MENLAGVATADEVIKTELAGADIPIVTVEMSTGEVPFTLVGDLQGFAFRRAWYYWVVRGHVPIAVAQELYANPVGSTEVRVAGHCGCPSPETWADWITPDGKVVLPTAEEEGVQGLLKAAQSLADRCLFSDDPASLGAEQYVSVYHIDTQAGLQLFADTIRAHNLVTAPLLG